MTIRSGVDIMEISRIKDALDRHGERFLERILTPAEINECKDRPDRVAIHFSAKEAAAKALGTGIGPVSWIELEVLHKPSGEPYLSLHGRAEQVAKLLGLKEWSLSLSHSREYAVAVVIATGK
jgi:holo-[acyl-carrier protein] synthase